MAELAVPAIGEGDRDAMLELICHGAFSANQIEARPVLSIVKSWLSRQQQGWMEEYAPERIQRPHGRTVKVVYSVATGRPDDRGCIQDLYGIKERALDRQPPHCRRIQVLAPSNRPVQVTENLAVFWRETYPKLKQELQRKYPSMNGADFPRLAPPIGCYRTRERGFF
jgi:ATP-dependent helicase HrpB